MKYIYLYAWMFLFPLGAVWSQAPASPDLYAFGKQVFRNIKEQKADLLIALIDEKADENTKQIISTSILNTLDKFKTLGNPAGVKMLNVLFHKNSEKIFIPILVNNKKIVMLAINKPVNVEGRWFLGGSLQLIDSTKEKQLTEARKLYMSKCFSCHGQMAEGSIAPNLTDEFWKYAQSDDDVINLITNGKKGTLMIAFKDYLSNDQIREIVLYLSILQGQQEKKGKQPEGKTARLLRDLYLK